MAVQRGRSAGSTTLNNGDEWQQQQQQQPAAVRKSYKVGEDEIGIRREANTNFLRAVCDRNFGSVLQCLETGLVDIDATDPKGNAALHVASVSGRDDLVKLLISKGAKVNIQTQKGLTPLYMAAQENHIKVVQHLLDHGADQNLATEDGYTPQAVAAKRNYSQVVTLLAENEKKSKTQLQALHAAAKKDDVKAAWALLRGDGRSNKICSVNDVTTNGFTPLHIAAHYGSEKVACVLLENGANVNFKAGNDVTPLHVASKWGKSRLVALLIDNGGDMDAKTKDNLTPLHCAARSGHEQAVEVLVTRRASVLSKTKNGLTPLHMSIQGDHVECARKLLDYKADIEEVTMDYLTPLHIAAHCGNWKSAKHLIDSGCIVDSRALNGFTPLHVACKKNRVKVIELLLHSGASIEATTESGLTPLHVAAFLGHPQVITLLLEKGANIEKPTLRGETTLHMAARANQMDIMRLLLCSHANVDAKGQENQTPLHVTSRLGNVEAVRLLLEHGANRDATTKELYTPLHIAVKEGHEEIIQLLLDNGAKQKVKTKHGFTPLHIAAKYGNARVTRLLLQKTSNPNIEGKNGLAPLHVATHYNNPEVATVLLNNGANVHATAKNGYTALHIAAKKNHVDLARIMLNHGGKSNVESRNGFTPLHLAAQEGHAEVADLLLDHKADAKCKAKNGLTPIHLAAQEDHVPVAETLVKHGSPIDMQTKAGYTPLHTACHFGQLNMIRFLLQNGASVNAATKLGYTPLHQAAQQGHLLVINLLLKHKASPDILTESGQSPLSIAHRMGFLSVVEILRTITTVDVPMSEVDDGYKIVYPETMLEAPMDSDEEGGDEILEGRGKTVAAADKYKHIRRPEKNILRGQDPFEFESQSGRYSTILSGGGHDTIHDELSYMRDDTELRHGPMTPSTASTRDSVKHPLSDSDRHGSVTPAVDELKYHLSDDSPQFSDVWTPSSLEFSLSDQYKFRTKVNGSVSHRHQSDEIFNHLEEVHTTAAAALQHSQTTPPTAQLSEIDYHLRQAGGNSYFSTATSLMSDNIALEREPVYSGFLVSFVVDARGGVLNGSRHSGIRLIIPQGRATMPTRVVCKLVKKEKLTHPPPLNEGEALATRILQMGNAGTKFSGPVLLEVPHFASIQGREREIAILRSDNGINWNEHPLAATDENVHQALGSSFPELESAEKLYERKVARILTDSLPSYFAIITRIRQDSQTLGPKGGIITSSVVPQVQAQFPEGALTKAIKVGLRSHVIDKGLVKKVLGDNVAVSPVVTIEPRHRKFHQPITITIPIPESEAGSKDRHVGAGSPTLRLLCSLVGGVALSQWEDITGSSPLSLNNDCVSFTTTVSARFWLMDCQNINACARMANDLYHEAISVPLVAKFAIFGRRRNAAEARLRAFCLTDDKLDKTLEKEQYFKEIARSKDFEVFEGKALNIGVAGNLEPVLKSDEPLLINFQSFHENRRHFLVRLKDPTADPTGKILFTPPASDSPIPLCVLSVALPEIDQEPRPTKKAADGVTPGLEIRGTQLFPKMPAVTIHEASLNTTSIACAVGDDWMALADELGVPKREVEERTDESDPAEEKGLALLGLWIERKKELATGNELERALRQIGREDVIYSCLRNIRPVTDEQEIRSALMSIERGMTSVVEPVEESLSCEVFQGLHTVPELEREAEAESRTENIIEKPFEADDLDKVNVSETSHENFQLQAVSQEESSDKAFSTPIDNGEISGLRIYTDTQEGLPELETDIQETEEILDDGSVVRRKVIVTQQTQRIVQRVVIEGPEDELPGTEEQAEEVLRHLDVHNPECNSDAALEPSAEIEEFEEILPTGEVVKRRIVTTTSHQTTRDRAVLYDAEDDS